MKTTHIEAITKFIKAAQKLNPKYKGVHTVYGTTIADGKKISLNEFLRGVFPGENPVDITTNLMGEKKLVVVPRKGGATVYLSAEAPTGSKTSATDAAKLLGIS